MNFSGGMPIRLVFLAQDDAWSVVDDYNGTFVAKFQSKYGLLVNIVP